MPTVRLGNPQAIQHATGEPVEGSQVTEADLPAQWSLAEQVRAVVHDDPHFHGLWKAHSAAAAPSWVESDSPELAQALAAHYGSPIGAPATDTQEG